MPGEGDEDAWVRALSETIDSQAARSELSRKGIERARSEYAWPIVARNHLEFFSQLLDGSAAQR
jgi:glycosyltransferase involved in cell wall biosynthesis